MKISPSCKLYGILDMGYVSRDSALSKTESLIAAGAGIIQLRAKTLPPELLLPLAKEILPICKAAKIPFIINDYPEIAAEIDASGVHLGQDDLSVADARRILGPNKIVGKSTHSLQQATDALLEAPDYLGFGPIFPTLTKPDYTPIGLSDIAEVHRRVHLPIFCIGGIHLENLPIVLAAGASRVAIVSALLEAKNTVTYGNQCSALLNPSSD